MMYHYTISHSVSTNTDIARVRVQKIDDFKWKRGSLITNDISLVHNPTSLPSNILNFDLPLQFFSYFLTNELFEKIKNESELYSAQKNPNKPFSVSIVELKRYVGICLYASVCYVPNVRDY